jgi:hypothetical protein
MVTGTDIKGRPVDWGGGAALAESRTQPAPAYSAALRARLGNAKAKRIPVDSISFLLCQFPFLAFFAPLRLGESSYRGFPQDPVDGLPPYL